MQKQYNYAQSFLGERVCGELTESGKEFKSAGIKALCWKSLLFIISLLPYQSAQAQQMSPEWIQKISGGNVIDLKRDAAGNIYVTGSKYFSGSGYDFVTAKYNAAGEQQWSKSYTYPYYGSSTSYYGGYTTEASDTPVAMAIDAAGNVYVLGRVTTGIYYFTWSDGDSSPSYSSSYGVVKYNSAGEQVWAQTFRGDGSSGPGSLPEDIAVDASGNVYVTGTVTINYRTESYRSGFRTRYRNVSDQIYATVKYNAAGNQQWYSTYNGTVDASDAAKSITVDGSGNVYVSGTVAGGTNNNNIGVAKYNASGTQQWFKVYTNGTNAEEAVEMETDGAGNLYVIGTTTGYTYDPSWGSNMLDLAKRDFLTLKYRMSDGAQLWAKAYNGPGNNTDEARAIALDISGNIYVVGSTYDGNKKLGAVKYNPSGSQLWAKQEVFAATTTSVSGADGANAVTVDAAGNVFVAGGAGGYFAGVKYNSSGTKQWSIYHSKEGGSNGAKGLAIDASGNPYMAGDDKVIKFSPNFTPVAVNDAYAVEEDQLLTIALSDNHLLKNDTDADGNPLTAVAVTQPTKGTLTLNANGTFTYKPNANLNGTDSFTYKANDGRADSESPATVTITIHPVNDAPTWVLTSMPIVSQQDAGMQVVQDFATSKDDGDPEATQESQFFIVSNTNPDLFKTLEVSRDGMLIYEAKPGASGSATIGVKLKDEGGTARGGKDESEVKNVLITVEATNAPPVLANVPTTVSIPELQAYTFTATATDQDQPAQPLAFSLQNAPDGAVIGATTGVFTWTPTEAQGIGNYSFKVVVSDGVATAEKPITITVSEVNVAPVLSGMPVSATIPEMQAYTFTASATDADLPKQDLVFSLQNAPAGAQINASTGVFTWTPTEAQGPSTQSIVVRVSDGLVSVEKTIVLTVTEVNVAPVLANVPATATIPELQAYTFTAIGTDSDSPVQQTLAFSLVNGPEGASINTATGAFTWTPAETQGPGTYAFKVKVSDGAATAERDITLTVTEVNLPPVLTNVPISASISELKPYVFIAKATDEDAPAQSLTFSLANGPAGATIHATTGTFAWTPTEAQGPGTFSFKVRVSDGVTTVEKTISLVVTEVNEAPVLAAIPAKTAKEETLLSFSAVATDPDLPANAIHYSLVDGPAGAQINATTGAFTWTPTEAQGPKVYTFTIKAIDSDSPEKFDEQLVTITVEEVNKAPMLGALPASGTVQELQAYTFTATATDADAPAQNLTFSLLNPPAGASMHPTTGAFSWTPTEAQGPGSYTIRVRVSDGELYDEDTFTLQVAEANSAPVLAALQNQTIDEEKVHTFTATATDADVPAQILTYSLLNAPAGAAIQAATGVITLNHTEAQGPGSYTMTIRVTDSGIPALYDEQTITVSINEVNKAPILANVPVTATICEQQAYTFTATATDADLPATTLRFSLGNAPSGASIHATSGVFTWSPSLNQGGSNYSIAVKVTDGIAVVEKQVVITVNKLPRISAQPLDKTICAGSSHTFQVQAQGSGFTYRWQVDQGNGFADLSEGGSYSGTGTASLTISGAPFTFNNYKYRVQVAGVCVPGVTSQVSTLRVLQPLQAGSIGTGQTICYNSPPAAFISSTDASGGDGSYQYAWEISENNSTWTTISGARNATFAPGALTKTTFFRRKVSTPDGCTAAQYSNVVQVTVLGEQKPGVLAAVAPVCFDMAPATLQVTGEMGGRPTYQWQSSLDNVNWQDVSNGQTASYAPGKLSGSTYFRRQVTFENGICGVWYSNAVLVEVFGEFKGGTIDGNQVIFYSDTPARLSSLAHASGGSGVVTYQWEVSKNGTSFTAIPDATSQTYQPGALTQTTYFRRKATDATCGTAMSNVVTVNVEVREFKEQEIPNALFPKGSDRNKTWGVAHMGLTGKVNVRVFDRSGRILFSSTKPEQEWDGTYNGKPVPEDTYFYTVQLGDGKQIKGTIRVIY